MIGIPEQLLRLFIASIVGILIGAERTKRGKSAGVATFSIICITSCFLTLISAYGFKNSTTDPTRLVANIITAIGFVAGGVIFTIGKDNQIKVTGITTGAIIFCVASLGIGIGLGLYWIVFTAILLVELNLIIAMKLKKHYAKQKKYLSLDEEEDYNPDL
ncbi:MgtC/SapB family protein [Inconstantimicrobium mannanitabidum]|uniref:Uncharacterized protein n=1 Tax=Inconstantimicrobium mannanitabidum TaxID=1604901 RepID=A0ACB5RA16_9CLOT|nr:MgtC/SapB family protein [Clostridium sp. TW13]GKX65982.1 hypothetical protein rsdtw13_12400 [Clostridium sp. TW13]